MNFNIEAESGKTVKLPTAGKYCDRDIVVTGFGSDEAELQAKYDEGVTAGQENGAAICAAKHFVHNFVGDGGTSVSFCVPFEPDTVELIGYDPLILHTPSAVLNFIYDIASFGRVVGSCQSTDASISVKSAVISHTGMVERFSQAEDGTITLHDLGSSSHTSNFIEGFVYTVIAVKYTEQTDKERITEFVNKLTESGTVILQQEKVNAALTEDEWAALIATKPDWTFTWI